MANETFYRDSSIGIANVLIYELRVFRITTRAEVSFQGCDKRVMTRRMVVIDVHRDVCVRGIFSYKLCPFLKLLRDRLIPLAPYHFE